MSMKRQLPIPAHVRADWNEPEPIDAALSHKRYNWVCRTGYHGQKPCGKGWAGTLIGRIQTSTPSGCPYCKRRAQRKPLPGPIRAQWADPRPIDEVSTHDRSAKWSCGCGRTWKASINSRRQLPEKLVCTRCAARAPRVHLRTISPSEGLLQDWDEEFPIEQAFTKGRYRWVHRSGENPCGKFWEARLDNRLRGDGCPHYHGTTLHSVTARAIRKDRAIEVLRRVAGGHSFAEAARAIGITPHTVMKWRNEGLLPKTERGCTLRAQRRGLVEIPLEANPPAVRPFKEIRAEKMREVARLRAEGKSTSEAARLLKIVEGTAHRWVRAGLI